MMRYLLSKKGISLLLMVCLVMTLSACGKDGQTVSGRNSSSNLSKQYVFSYDEITIDENLENAGVYGMYYTNEKIYMLLQSYEGSNAGLLRSGYGVQELGAIVEEVTVNDEDSNTEDAENAEDDTENATDDTDIMYPEDAAYTAIYKLITFNLDGSDVNTVILQNDNSEATDGYLNQMTVGTDGNIYAVKYYSRYDDSDVYEEWQELICWSSEDGSQKWGISLDEMYGDSDYGYVQRIVVANGNIHLLLETDGYKLVSIDENGSLLSQKELDRSIFQNISNIFGNSDGSLKIITYNDDWTKMYAFSYDLNTGTAGEKVELPGNFNLYGIYQGNGCDFLLNGNGGVYTYNIGDTEITQIMNFINSDLGTSYLQYITMLDQEHLVGMYYDETDNYSMKTAIFTKVDPKDVPDKETLILGANYLDSATRKQIINFNKTNSKYRIAVRDYSEYATMNDYMASYTQLNNDIISGNMPDILVVDSNVPVENYISKGLIADIGEFIERDEELSQVEYMDNVFDAYRVNGTLYYLVPSFNVRTVIGKTSLVGDREGWNMEEFMALMDSLPEGTNSFGEVTRSYFLTMLMQYCGTDLIDVSTGKCNFESQEFINMLEFAATLPDSYDYYYEDDYDWTAYQSQYRDNRTVLMETYIGQIKGLTYTLNGYFGEDINYIGFPCEGRNGSVISAGTSYVLSAKSGNLDGAWEFVRYYLTDDCQTGDDYYGLPVKKDVFYEKAAEALERPYYLENGEKVEYDDIYYMNDEEITLPPLNQEQLEQVTEFISSIDRKIYYNENITNIINEEAEAFFSGQKSAADVAKIIQSRAQIYVDENR